MSCKTECGKGLEPAKFFFLCLHRIFLMASPSASFFALPNRLVIIFVPRASLLVNPHGEQLLFWHMREYVENSDF